MPAARSCARTPALRSLGTSGKWAAPAKAQRAWKPCGQSHSCCDSWATSSCCGCHCDQVKRQTFHPVKDVGGGPWRLFGSVCLVQCASNLCVQRLLMGNCWPECGKKTVGVTPAIYIQVWNSQTTFSPGPDGVTRTCLCDWWPPSYGACSGAQGFVRNFDFGTPES